METLGQILEEERKRHQSSRRALADRAGLPEITIRRIEKGMILSNPEDLQKIAQALAINPVRFIEPWLKAMLKGVTYNPSVLDQLHKPEMDQTALESMYGIDKAREAYEKIKDCTTGKKMQETKQETLLEVRLALKNCLGLIDDLKK